jgi:hypothetical protein
MSRKHQYTTFIGSGSIFFAQQFKWLGIVIRQKELLTSILGNQNIDKKEGISYKENLNILRQQRK